MGPDDATLPPGETRAPGDAPGTSEAVWVEEVLPQVPGPGRYLAWREGDEFYLAALDREWTRIGRSLLADVRFDDPSVSRRHALLVRAPDGVKILDDRSTHGTWVNGRRVEWSPLADGDEIRVGAHALRFLEVVEAPVALT